MPEEQSFFKSQFTGQEIEEAISDVLGGTLLKASDADQKYLALKGGGSISDQASGKSLNVTPGALVATGNIGGGNMFDVGAEKQDLRLIAYLTKISETDDYQGSVLIQGKNIVLSPNEEDGVIQTNNRPITGLPEPVNPSDAANKKYVDDNSGLTQAEADQRYLKLTGGEIKSDANDTIKAFSVKLSPSNIVVKHTLDAISVATSMDPNKILATASNGDMVSIGSILSMDGEERIGVEFFDAEVGSYIALAYEIDKQTGRNVLVFRDDMLLNPILSIPNAVPEEDYDVTTVKFVKDGFLPLTGKEMDEGAFIGFSSSDLSGAYMGDQESVTGLQGSAIFMLGPNQESAVEIRAEKRDSAASTSFLSVLKIVDSYIGQPVRINIPLSGTFRLASFDEYDLVPRKFVEEYVAQSIGDINTVLDAINGEVV